jgi:FkbM family methyltransferase
MALMGSGTALKFARRDLVHLDAVLALVPGRTACVQAGGNLGVYPSYLAKTFETVYCFEPALDLFEAMVANAPEPNIVRLQAALGQSRGLVGTSRIRRDGKANAHEGITYVVPGGQTPTLLLDDLALPVCDLVQLDIEGMEYAALKGAVQTLQRCRPVVAIEINKNLRYVNVTEAEIVGFLAGLGYRHALTVGSDQAFVPVEHACR